MSHDATDGPPPPARLPLLDDPANRVALAQARGRIAENARTFEALVDQACRETDPLAQAAWAQVACDFAERRHTGRLADARLEDLLHELGRTAVGPVDPAPERRGVLHVATTVYDTGGHSRVLERWIERDAQRRPSVVVLRPGPSLPQSLLAAIERRGGTLAPPPAGDLLERARGLRALAARHELVVLHHHPYDVVPALALAWEHRPPVVLFNHASHVQWAGLAGTDVVANFWAPDVDATVRVRGVPAERSLLLPLPCGPRDLPERARAREGLGLPPGQRVVLAVASAWKVQPVLRPAFGDVLRAVRRAAPDALVLVVGHVGHSDDPMLRFLGGVAGVGPLMAAADVLVDGWPISGCTTLIDAGAARLPVVSLGNGDPGLSMVRPPRGTLGDTVVHAPDADGVGAAVAGLLADEERRRELGDRAHAAVVSAHDAAWGDHLEAVVAGARALRSEPWTARPAPPGEPPLAQCVLELSRAASGAGLGPAELLALHAPELPPALRPATPADAAATAAAVLERAARPRRVLLRPALDQPSVSGELARARAVVGRGEAAVCTVVVPAAEVARAVPFLEQALAEGADLDVELVAEGDPEAVPAAGDVVLA